MKGNRLSYEIILLGQTNIVPAYKLVVRSYLIDEYTWITAYAKGYRTARYPVPAFARSTTISGWCVTTFEAKESYDHVTKEWDFDTLSTPHMEWCHDPKAT